MTHMSSNFTAEYDQFRQFLDRCPDSGASFGSLTEAVEEFQRYQRELADAKARLRTAEEQAQRGEVGPFDAQATMRRVNKRLASQNGAE